MVSSINDEYLLELVKAAIEYFNGRTDILNELGDADRKELLNLLNEPEAKDMLTEDEYKAATAKWRTK